MKVDSAIETCFYEYYIKLHIDKHLSDAFPGDSGLKPDVLLPLLFSLALEYAIRKVKVIQEWLELNGTFQLVVCAGDVILFDDNINTIMENTDTLIATNREVVLEVNIEKIKYCLTEYQRWMVAFCTLPYPHSSCSFIIL
jgi:hypothetical protein